MKKAVMAVVLLLAAAVNCCCADNNHTLGSANTPEGTTIVVSVFASDNTYAWDFETETDISTKDNILNYLGIASGYLHESAEKYGKEASFIYDFEQYDDLYYEADFDTETTMNDAADAELCMNAFLDEYVDSEGLKQKYAADNIIYFMFVNTDTGSQAISCTRNYYEGMEYPYEIVFLFNVDDGIINCPAVYAHEMLHTFGAPDLYYMDTEYGFTEEFLDYVQNNMQNDLMYNCSDLETGSYSYDRITNEIGELDAYYTGLTDESILVEQFGLKPSQHDIHEQPN